MRTNKNIILAARRWTGGLYASRVINVPFSTLF